MPALYGLFGGRSPQGDEARAGQSLSFGYMIQEQVSLIPFLDMLRPGPGSAKVSGSSTSPRAPGEEAPDKEPLRRNDDQRS